MKKTLFSIAALSATCLIAGSAFAASDTMSGSSRDSNRAEDSMSASAMDVTQFRTSLHRVHDLFAEMRENRRLAVATSDPMVASQYQNDNRRLLTEAMGELDQISKNWHHADAAPMAGQTAEMNARDDMNMNRYGSADVQRYANESDDTAFVRTTVWDLSSSLASDKLNGRAPMITNKMMSQLDAAISRSENPTFRVARAMNLDRLAQIDISSSRREESTTTTAPAPPTPAPAETSATTTETTTDTTTQTETAPAPAEATPAPEETTPAPAETSTTDTTTTETTTDQGRMGAANLPQTGGDPGMLVFLGSGLAGLGMLLRKRS